MKFRTMWPGIKKRLANMALGISGHYFPVVDIPREENEIGYTSKDGNIHLAPSHPLMDKLTDDNKIVFVYGVFAHELMHKLETNFESFQKALADVPGFCRQIFAEIFNIMEDAAIEYWAPHYYGNALLKPLRFTIARLYATAPPLEESKTPFSQFICACIQYGDGGFPKGNFTFPEAKKTFFEVLPIMDHCTTEPNGKKRVELSMEVYNASKPLWIDELKNAEKMQELLKELAKLMGESGKGIMGNGAKPVGDLEKEPVPKDKGDPTKEKRKAILVKRFEEEKGGNPSESDSDDGSDVRNGKKGENKKKASGSGKGDEEKESKEKGKSKSAQKGIQEKRLSHQKEGHDPGYMEDDPETGDLEEEIPEMRQEDYELSQEDISDIKEEIEQCLKELDAENYQSEKERAEPLPDIPEVAKDYPGVRCLNLNMSGDFTAQLEESYNQIVDKLQGGITLLSNQLMRVIRNEKEEREYKTSGRLDIKRYTGSRKTARIFSKRTTPKNVSDMAVLVLIDCSGSMRGKKERIAKETAIGLAEALAKVKIPYKVIGFTADNVYEGISYSAIHFHYVNWHDSKRERIKLSNIAAGGNNFDGYSIRYAGELLAKRPEERKLLLVVSDGQPACVHYAYGSLNGIADTTRAIRLVTKKVKTIGIAIDANVEVLHKMYGANFLYINKVDTLFQRLGQIIKKEMRTW